MLNNPILAEALAINLKIKNRELFLELLNKDLRTYIKWCFNLINPNSTYMHAWHIDCMAEYLEACFYGQIKRMIFNLPPRSYKSTIINGIFPSWVLGKKPSTKIMSVSDSIDVGIKFARECREIMLHTTFGRAFPSCRLARDQREKLNYSTTVNGVRKFTTSGVLPRGLGYDYLFLDDYFKEIKPGAVLQEKTERITEFFGRGNRNSARCQIIIEQRLGLNDVTGYVIGEGVWKKGSYEHLVIPAYEKENRTISFGKFHIQRHAGDYMEDTKDFKDAVIEWRDSNNKVNQKTFETQWQQNPCIDEGEIFRKEHFNITMTSEAIKQKLNNNGFEHIVASCDTAHNIKSYNDYSVIMIFGLEKGNAYLIDVIRDRWEYPDLKQKIGDVVSYYKPDKILIEKKASGQDLIPDFAKNGFPSRIGGKVVYASIVPITPTSDKVSRALQSTDFLCAGRLIIPTETNELDMGKDNWLLTFEQELLKFPSGKFDDQVDALTQFINWMTTKGVSRPPRIIV